MAFSYYKVGTIDATQCGTADSTNFPVGIYIVSDNDLRTVGNGGFVVNANGYDIRPYADAALTTPLTYELVQYDATAGKVEMWFTQPTLSHTVNGTVYLAFGDSTISTDGSSTTTWDANYASVWHLKDGTTLSLTDSTSNANNGTNHSATATSGLSGGGMHTTAASSQYADMGAGSSLNITGAMTIEGWLLVDSVTSFPRFLGREVVATNLGYAVYYGGAPSNIFFRMYTGTGVSDISSVSTFATATWVHFVGTIDGSKNGIVYVNGAQDNTGTFASLATTGASTFLLATRNDLTRFHDGKLDEVRISNVVRSASYVTATYNNTKLSNTFLSWGSKVSAFTFESVTTFRPETNRMRFFTAPKTGWIASAHQTPIPAFSIEMTRGDYRPSSGRLPVPVRMSTGLTLDQNTHVPANVPAMVPVSGMNGRWPTSVIPKFDHAGLQNFRDVTATPVSLDMLAGSHPDNPRVPFASKPGWMTAQPTPVSAVSPEMVAGQHVDRARLPFTAPAAWQTSQLTPVIVLSPEMMAGLQPERPRLYRVQQGFVSLTRTVDGGVVVTFIPRLTLLGAG